MGNRKRSDVDTETALAVVREEQNMERFKQEQQTQREQMIAQAHEIIGRVQANSLMGKFATVSNLVHLKQIKETKIYRDLPMVGTWDKYCEYLGLSRQKVDEDLMNLAAFGEDFLLTCQQFHLGYRDLRKLRQLSHDGSITIDANALTIGGESIPLTADRKEDLQAAIEQVIEEQERVKEELAAQNKAFDRVQDDTRKSMTKLQRELDKLAREAAGKELTADEDAFLQRMENLRIGFDGYMLKLDHQGNFLFNEITDVTPRMNAALISTAQYMKMQILAAYDQLVMTYGNPAMNPEIMEEYEAWEKEQAAAPSP